MSTVIIDFKNKKVFTDTQMTRKSWKANKWISVISFGILSDGVKSTWTDFTQTTCKATLRENFIIVGTGCSRTIEKFATCYPTSLPNAAENTSIFVLSSLDSTVRVLEYQSTKKWGFCRWKESSYNKSSGYITIGSGSSYAFGALMANVAPEDAIKAASKADVYTNDEIKDYDIPRL